MPRRQDGQTAAEYAGILLLIAAVLFGLAQTDAAGRVRTGVETAICQITGGECGEEEEGNPWAGVHTTVTIDGDDDGATSDDDDDDELPTGPAFGDGEFPVPGIPWAGSVTTGADAGPDDGLYVEASVTEERSACTRNSDGDPQVDLSVTGSFVTGARGEAERRGATLGADSYIGRSISWQISTDPENADRFQDGVGVPSPVDPGSIPEGTTLTLDEASYEGLDLGVAYKGIGVTLGYENGESVSSAVERVDADTVRVTVGNSEYIDNMGAVDLGAFSLGSGRDSTGFRAKQVDLDLSTAAGRRAYGEFVTSGTLPAPGTGVSGITDVASRTNTSRLPAALDTPLQAFGVDAGSRSYEAATTTRPDGTTEYSIFDGGTGNTRVSTWEVSPDGVVSDGTTTITWADMEPGAAEVLEEALTGADAAGHEDGQDLSATFTQDDLRAMQDAFADAADYNDAHADEGGGESSTQADALRKLAEASPDQFAAWLAESPTDLASTIDDVRADAARQRYHEEGASEEEALAAVPAPASTATRPTVC